MTFTVDYDPDGYAPNMGYVVKDESGNVQYRGPLWAAEYRAYTWNDGRTVLGE